MRILVSHPVPVRWRPPRARADRVAYRAETTAAELPEVSGPFGEPFSLGTLFGKPLDYRLHDGGLWREVSGKDLAQGANGAASLDDVIAFLRGRGPGAPGFGLARNGTPLSGTSYPAPGKPDPHGIALPDRVMALAREDHTAACREALARHMRDNVATDGRSVYVRVSPPVIMPGCLPMSHPELPWYATRGPGFRPHQEKLIRRYVAISGINARPEYIDQGLERLPPCDGALYGEMDVGHFVNGAPALLGLAGSLLSARLEGRGEGMPREAVAALDRLTSLGDLGLVGAIPRERWAEAVELTQAAAGGLRAAIADGYRSEFLGPVEAYMYLVAEPWAGPRPAPAIPEEDADSLGGLSPR